MNFHPNDLFFTMAEAYATRVTPESKVIIGNEGSSRSAKTWDAIHFIVAFCSQNKDKPQDIYILRDTLVNCRDFTMKEFQDCLKVIGIYDPNCMIQSPKPVYTLWGHKIKFRGVDDEQSAEGYPSDVLFFNEALEQSQSGVMALIMRCRKMVIMDWNPKYTDHWVFDMEKREDAIFTHSTYKNNRHLQKSVVKEIESYSPWHLDDLHLPEDDRRPHHENIKNGTADKYRFMVYGMGLRANREGLVFPEVTYVDKMPDDVEEYSYGMDFGKTAQTAIVRTAIRRRKPKNDIYLQKLFYHPTSNANVIDEVLRKIFYDPKTLKKDDKPPEGMFPTKHIHCDNNLPGLIADLRRLGHFVYPTTKFPGSREYWIAHLKKFNIHIVKDPDFRKEQENFSYRVLDGKTLSETIKDYDHLWSASGYSTVGDFRE